jgi:maleate isomerase
MSTTSASPVTVPPERRVGAVVPPGNPVVEREIHALLRPALFPYVCRFPAYPALGLADRLSRYVIDTPEVVGELADVRVAAAYVACTGSSYALGTEGNRAWIGAATAATGAPVTTAAAAVTELLRALAVDRLRIVSPYPEWLGRRCLDYWLDAGFTVAGVHNIVRGDADSSGAHPVYGISQASVTREIENAVDAATTAGGKADAVLVAGTGVATVDAFDLLVTATSIVMVSANVAAARWLLLATGHAEAVTASDHPSLSQLAGVG